MLFINVSLKRSVIRDEPTLWQNRSIQICECAICALEHLRSIKFNLAGNPDDSLT